MSKALKMQASVEKMQYRNTNTKCKSSLKAKD